MKEDNNGFAIIVVVCLSLCCIFPDACGGGGGGRQLKDGEYEIGGKVLTESDWSGMSQSEKADLIQREMESYE